MLANFDTRPLYYHVLPMIITFSFFFFLVSELRFLFALFSYFSISFLANVNSRSRSLYVIGRPSVVCRLSVTFMRPTQAIEIIGNVPTPFGMLASADIKVKFYGDRPRGTPPSGELNTRGVAEYSDFGHRTLYLRNGAI